MSEIKINVSSLNNGITQLKNLKTFCINNKKQSPETVGGGLTVAELESLGNLYEKLNSQFIDLLAGTISFMENVKISYESSDKKAANNFSGK